MDPPAWIKAWYSSAVWMNTARNSFTDLSKRTKLCVATKKSSAWKRPASCRLGKLREFHPLQNFSLTVWREADSTGCWPALGVKSNPQNVLMRTYFVSYLLVLAYSQLLMSWQHIAWSQCVFVCMCVLFCQRLTRPPPDAFSPFICAANKLNNKVQLSPRKLGFSLGAKN